jgi:hypothetical protein
VTQDAQCPVVTQDAQCPVVTQDAQCSVPGARKSDESLSLCFVFVCRTSLGRGPLQYMAEQIKWVHDTLRTFGSSSSAEDKDRCRAKNSMSSFASWGPCTISWRLPGSTCMACSGAGCKDA